MRGMTEQSPPPTKAEVTLQLEMLIRGDISREDASAWEEQWINRLTEVPEAKVRRAIDQLWGADSPTTDRAYLFVQEDLESWLAELSP